MRNPVLFYGAIVVAVVALALAVFYLVPGIYHPLTFSGTPTESHTKHAIAFFILAVICVIGAFATRGKATQS